MIPITSTTLIAVWALVIVVAAGDVCHSNKPIENEDFKISCGPPGLVTLLCKSDSKRWSNFPKEQLNLSGFNVSVEKCGFPDDDQFHLLEPINSLGLKKINKLTFSEVKTPLKSGLLTGISVRILQFNRCHRMAKQLDHLLDGMQIEEGFWINSCSLTELPADFFRYQGNITHIDLNYNNIERLSRTLFEPLTKLKILYMNPNRLLELEDGLFDRQTELEALDIGKNLLKTLPPNIFRNLKKLHSLHIGKNNFTELPAQLLHNQNESLKNFHMNENQGTMKTLPDNFFKNLRKLEEVWMFFNQFTSLPANLFIGVESLKYVNFSYNQLTTLPSRIFAEAPNLQQLRLTENLLNELPDDVFSENANLEELYLNNNRLTNLTEGVLGGLHNLKILDVSRNSLVDMSLKICDGQVNSNLKHLDISYNNLTTYGTITNCVDLKTIVASNNNISEIITLDIINKKQLKTFNLANNRITELPLSAIVNQMRDTPALSFLDVSNNQISSINMRNYAEANVKVKLTVDISRNPLHCDCHIYDFIYYLETKQSFNLIKENVFCAGPPELVNRSIEEVSSYELKCPLFSNATGDACNELCACSKIPGYKRLVVDCSNRNLKSIPAMILNPQNWSIALNMSRNNLQITSPMNRSYYSKVVLLDLSSNNISIVTLDVFSGSLSELQLHNNSITKLEPKVVEYLTEDTRLNNLTLHQNNWNCNCEASDFLKFVRTKLSKFQLDKVNCYGTDKLLSTMTSDELCPTPIAIIVGASLVVAFFGVVIGILAALYYKYQKEIKIWLYSKQLCLRFVTENELDKDKKYDAFISFSHKDEDFVVNEIINKLEEGPNPYKLCVHYRDWLAGEWITEQIARSVEESRRTIVVLSPNFLESVWGGMEFRTAHNQALKEGRARVILLLYGDIGNTDDLDPELKAYLSMNTYVKWGDPWFWDKLRYALPHRYKPTRSKTRNARLIENHLVQMSVPTSNSNGKAEIIPMPNINATATHDSVKLLDPRTEEDRTVSC